MQGPTLPENANLQQLSSLYKFIAPPSLSIGQLALARLAASEPSASPLMTTLPRRASSSSTIPIGRGRLTASTLLGCGRILHATVLTVRRQRNSKAIPGHLPT